MNERTLSQRIERLPKWARRYIAGLECRIDGPSLQAGSVNAVSYTRREIQSVSAVEDAELARRRAAAVITSGVRPAEPIAVVQLQPDDDSPGLWIGFATMQDRARGMSLFTVKT